MLMGRRQAELSTCDHAFLHEPKSCLAPKAALTPWQTVTCTLWCQRRRPFCFLQVRVSQQIKEIMGRREEIPFFGFLLSWLFLTQHKYCLLYIPLNVNRGADGAAAFFRELLQRGSVDE